MNESMNEPMELLKNGLSQMSLPQDERTLSLFETYMNMVLLKNQQMNLTAITDPKDFVIKHFIDSLAICSSSAMAEAKTIVDMGTGAGFPGIPLAIIYPEKQFLLVDSLHKKILFLKETTAVLNLKNVESIHSRAEDLGRDEQHREKYDLCVSRAVAKLSVLSEYCLPLVALDGSFAAYKSEGEDLSLAENALQLLGGEIRQIQPFPPFSASLPHAALEHKIVYIRKVKQTPTEYPRKAGLPTKSPL